jgi:tetratricopeptide (TPR) repeat protein
MESSLNSEIFNKGVRSYICDNFKQAISNFSELIKADKSNFEALLYRASSYIKIGNYSESLKDLIIAEKLNSKSFELFYKKGIANFKLENFLEAYDCFKIALTLASNSEQRDKLVLWTNKLDIEMEENNLLQKLESQVVNEVVPSNPSNTSNIKIIHSWYQTPTHLIISLDSNSNLSQESLDFVFEKKSIKILDKTSGNLIWEMLLSNSISTDDSTVKTNNKKAELKLKKEIENFNWVTVDRAKVNELSSNFKPSYPTSSKVKKDWNNLEKEINQELANDAKNDPNEGMMRLFKEIYGNSSEETRRAMIKSFQTSGGTVLSTNWDEVRNKDYEGKDRPDAPKGQEWAGKK